VSHGEVEYEPYISVVEPRGVLAKNVKNINYGKHPNEAGWVGMELELYITPLDVSFFNIAVEEVPCNIGSHTGYFDNPLFSYMWYHTRSNGAGNWINLSLGNFFAYDTAAISGSLNQILIADGSDNSIDAGWIDGGLTWDIPFGWNESGTSGETYPHDTFAESTIQEVVIFYNGRTGVKKLGNHIVRMTNDVVILNMKVVQ
jgi:hypothetical protein